MPIARPAIACFSVDGNPIHGSEFAFRARIDFKVLHRIASGHFKAGLGHADPENPGLASRRGGTDFRDRARGGAARLRRAGNLPPLAPDRGRHLRRRIRHQSAERGMAFRMQAGSMSGVPIHEAIPQSEKTRCRLTLRRGATGGKPDPLRLRPPAAASASVHMNEPIAGAANNDHSRDGP